MNRAKAAVAALEDDMPMLLAVDYARFSTDQQDSVEDQHDMNEEIAREIPARIVSVFEDRAISRSVGDRKGLQALLAYLRKHPEIDFVIVTAFDRLIGDGAQQADVFRALEATKTRLWVDDRELDYTDPEQLAQAEQAAVDSGNEVIRARRRTRRALRIKNTKGVYTSRPPFGLRMKPLVGPDGREVGESMQLLDEKGRPKRSGAIERDPSTFEWLERIFEKVADGSSLLSVAKMLTAAPGIRTKNGNDTWTAQSVRKIIMNRTYLGERSWGVQRTVTIYGVKRQVVREEDDRDRLNNLSHNLGPVIDTELFERANAMLTKRQASWSDDKRKNPSRILDGLVVCGRCGMKMYARRDSKILSTGERAKTWRYYCGGYGRAVDGHVRRRNDGELVAYCSRSHSIAETRLIRELTGQATARAPQDAVSRYTLAPLEEEERDDVAELDKAIARARAAIERISDAYDEAVYDLAEKERRSMRHREIIATSEAALARQIPNEPIPLEAPATAVATVHAALGELERLALIEPSEDQNAADAVDHDIVAALRDDLASQVRRYVDQFVVDAPSIQVVLRR